MQYLFFRRLIFGRKVSINIKKKIKKNREVVILPIRNIKRYSRILLALSIIYLGIIVGFFDYAFNGLRESDLFENSYVVPDTVDIKFPEEKQNLIYIFMESTEMTNVSKDNGGVFDISITPNLEELALNNINFFLILIYLEEHLNLMGHLGQWQR
ncbi:MAG: hypothetical protein L6V91_04200 [Bacilli bacterium]|nr:MAG: hypothetical protein L6V91_04200 [Bacilli bacterium]